MGPAPYALSMSVHYSTSRWFTRWVPPWFELNVLTTKAPRCPFEWGVKSLLGDHKLLLKDARIPLGSCARARDLIDGSWEVNATKCETTGVTSEFESNPLR